MLTLQGLRDLGAEVDSGMNRCLNNEAFYLKLVGKALDSVQLSQLEKALSDHDLDTAFEICHAMKGVMANLSLTPLLNPAAEMTELLRSRSDLDYSPYLARLTAAYDALRRLAEA